MGVALIVRAKATTVPTLICLACRQRSCRSYLKQMLIPCLFSSLARRLVQHGRPSTFLQSSSCGTVGKKEERLSQLHWLGMFRLPREVHSRGQRESASYQVAYTKRR